MPQRLQQQRLVCMHAWHACGLCHSRICIRTNCCMLCNIQTDTSCHTMRRMAAGWHNGAQFFQHVLRRLHQLGTLFDQGVATARLRRVDRTRNSKNLFALLARQTCGYQRAGLQRSLYHQHAVAQARNDAVALGKMV